MKWCLKWWCLVPQLWAFPEAPRVRLPSHYLFGEDITSPVIIGLASLYITIMCESISEPLVGQLFQCRAQLPPLYRCGQGQEEGHHVTASHNPQQSFVCQLETCDLISSISARPPLVHYHHWSKHRPIKASKQLIVLIWSLIISHKKCYIICCINNTGCMLGFFARFFQI